jgi:hypothetical protein
MIKSIPLSAKEKKEFRKVWRQNPSLNAEPKHECPVCHLKFFSAPYFKIHVERKHKNESSHGEK